MGMGMGMGMVRWLVGKAPVAKLPTSVLGTHMVEGENILPEVVLKLVMAHMYVKEGGK